MCPATQLPASLTGFEPTFSGLEGERITEEAVSYQNGFQQDGFLVSGFYYFRGAKRAHLLANTPSV